MNEDKSQLKDVCTARKEKWMMIPRIRFSTLDVEHMENVSVDLNEIYAETLWLVFTDSR
jgi:hypothetical protein